MTTDRITAILDAYEYPESDRWGWTQATCTCGQVYIHRELADAADMPVYEYDICPKCNGEIKLPTPHAILLWDTITDLTPAHEAAIRRLRSMNEVIVTLKPDAFYAVYNGRVTFLQRYSVPVQLYRNLSTNHDMQKLRESIWAHFDRPDTPTVTIDHFVTNNYPYINALIRSIDRWRKLRVKLS